MLNGRYATLHGQCTLPYDLPHLKSSVLCPQLMKATTSRNESPSSTTSFEREKTDSLGHNPENSFRWNFSLCSSLSIRSRLSFAATRNNDLLEQPWHRACGDPVLSPDLLLTDQESTTKGE